MSLIILGFTGCSHIAEYRSIAEERGISKEYLDILNTWTRKETVYSEFETKVYISAPYQGRAFKDAYLKEYGRIYNLTEADRAKRDAAQQDGESESSEKNDNDFSKQDSIWTVFLVDEKDERIVPLKVRKIVKVTPLIEVFYPYVNKYYGSCYSLKFPPGAGTDGQAKGKPGKPFKLVFASVLGKATLEWK